jgi:uncharacterized membrane protein YesL
LAGLFGFFDYTKPGKGVEKEEFKPNLSTFFRVLSTRFWKLLQLNLIYIIFSLPLIAVIFAFVPIGHGEVDIIALFKVCIFGLLYLSVVGLAPVTTGFTYVLRNFSGNRHSWVFSDFFEHIKKNFKQALLLLVIDVVISLIVPFIYSFYTNITNMGAEVSAFYKNISFMARTFVVMFSFIYFIMHFYIYQIMVTFDMKLKQILKNSLIFALSHLMRNIGVFIIIFAIAVLSFGYNTIIGVLLSILITPSLIGLIINFTTQPVVRKHMMIQTADDNKETEQS